MKKNKRKFARCPSCETDKYKSEIKIAITTMEKVDKTYYNYRVSDIDPYLSFIDSNFDWACDRCLETKKAIEAKPSLQTDSTNPKYAYFDTSMTCLSCKSQFVFSKEEKQFWYEKLNFVIYSKPQNCLKCRKDIRQLKLENKTLSEILKKDEKMITSDELKEVIGIYTKWESDSKVKYYKALLKKRNKK